MNLIDLSVIGLLVFFGILGVVCGLVRQLFFLGGLIVGHLVGVRFYATAASVLRLHFKYAEVVGYLAILLVVFVASIFLGGFIERKIHSTKLSFMDRVLGLAAGLLKGGVLAVLLVFVLVILLPEDAPALRKSRTVPQVIAAGKWIAKAFPARIADSFHEKIRAAEKRPPEGSFFSY